MNSGPRSPAFQKPFPVLRMRWTADPDYFQPGDENSTFMMVDRVLTHHNKPGDWPLWRQDPDIKTSGTGIMAVNAQSGYRRRHLCQILGNPYRLWSLGRFARLYK